MQIVIRLKTLKTDGNANSLIDLETNCTRIYKTEESLIEALEWTSSNEWLSAKRLRQGQPLRPRLTNFSLYWSANLNFCVALDNAFTSSPLMDSNFGVECPTLSKLSHRQKKVHGIIVAYTWDSLIVWVCNFDLGSCLLYHCLHNCEKCGTALSWVKASFACVRIDPGDPCTILGCRLDF